MVSYYDKQKSLRTFFYQITYPHECMDDQCSFLRPVSNLRTINYRIQLPWNRKGYQIIFHMQEIIIFYQIDKKLNKSYNTFVI